MRQNRPQRFLIASFHIFDYSYGSEQSFQLIQRLQFASRNRERTLNLFRQFRVCEYLSGRLVSEARRPTTTTTKQLADLIVKDYWNVRYCFFLSDSDSVVYTRCVLLAKGDSLFSRLSCAKSSKQHRKITHNINYAECDFNKVSANYSVINCQCYMIVGDVNLFFGFHVSQMYLLYVN